MYCFEIVLRVQLSIFPLEIVTYLILMDDIHVLSVVNPYVQFVCGVRKVMQPFSNQNIHLFL